MIIKTKDYGMVSIDQNDIINFKEGIFAFEDVAQFVILKKDGNSPIMRLQAVEAEDPRFVILDPYVVMSDYCPNVTQDTLYKLGAKDISELRFFVIAVIPKNIHQTTVNLRSPVVINFDTQLGLQVILDDCDYPLRHPIFAEGGKAEPVC